MRAWLYDTLIADPNLQARFGGVEGIKTRVMPRRSQSIIYRGAKPYIVYGLGNNTNEQLGEDTDHVAHRQFFQIWIYDEGGDYSLIDEVVELVKKLFTQASSPPNNITTITWLENSQEFSNETYEHLFRYVRFQAIISKGAAA